MYRVLRPVIFASIAVNGVLLLNQELLVPRVAFAGTNYARNDPSHPKLNP